MEFVIVTGLSGAGKTNALHAMEDIGFYCVDNIPPMLLETFYDLCENSTDNRMKKVAVVADVRSGEMFNDLSEVISKCKMAGKRFKILFLDAKTDTLLIRYKETRRKHPLSSELSSGSTADAVKLEAELMKPVKAIADYVIDTTYMALKQLKERVTTIFTQGNDDGLLVTCMSFGFKYGIPLEADLVFDVRCLPNPFYIPELKPLTGLDEEVREYVLKFDETQVFIEKLLSFLDYTIPLYKQEGKSEVVIGIGCTGGKHRSVTLARLLNSHFIENKQKSAIHHRDIWKA
ncbi:MAG: RNase adapter RapZ [Oscillospiraceae bacterium]|nr:RNase adapter RapZ [Candidatus Ruminococcus equi]